MVNDYSLYISLGVTSDRTVYKEGGLKETKKALQSAPLLFFFILDLIKDTWT